MKIGKSSFLFYNWTALGALYYIEETNTSEEEIEVGEFVTNGHWDRQKLLSCLSNEDIVKYIYEEIKAPHTEEENDKTWWMGNANDSFSVKIGMGPSQNQNNSRGDK